MMPTPGNPVYEASVRPDLDTGELAADWRYAFIADEDTAARVTFLLSGG
jgi:hypothetical protein